MVCSGGDSGVSEEIERNSDTELVEVTDVGRLEDDVGRSRALTSFKGDIGRESDRSVLESTRVGDEG